MSKANTVPFLLKRQEQSKPIKFDIDTVRQCIEVLRKGSNTEAKKCIESIQNHFGIR